MKKPIELRAHLARWVPDLAANPDKLHVLVEKGAVATRLADSLGFEYRYTLQLIVTDFAQPADVLIVPLLVWLQTEQPDLLMDTVRRDKALSFEAESSDNELFDIAITLELSERVLVSAVPSGFQCTHLGEPALPDLGGPVGWEVYLKGELIAEGNG